LIAEVGTLRSTLAEVTRERDAAIRERDKWQALHADASRSTG